MASGSRFDTLLNQVQSRLDTLETTGDELKSPTVDQTMPLDQQKSAVSRGLRELNQCQSNITEMERLIQTMPMRDREFFTQDIVSCRDTHRKLVADYNKYDEEVKRKVLLWQARVNQGLDGDMIARTGQKLDAANSNLDKAIAIGGDVLNGMDHAQSTLASDREALGRIDKNVDNIIAETEKANGLTNSMLGRALCNGILSWIIVVILLGLIALFVWAKFFPGGFMYKGDDEEENQEEAARRLASISSTNINIQNHDNEMKRVLNSQQNINVQNKEYEKNPKINEKISNRLKNKFKRAAQ